MSELLVESPAAAAEPPSLAALFAGFFKISIMGFGGVLMWSRRLIVEEKQWLTPEGFNELFAFCQFMPGANVISLSIILGHRLRGWPGAVATFCGLLTPSVALMITLGALYQRFGAMPQLANLLQGLAAATAGLFIAVALKMASPLAKLKPGAPHLICAVTVIAIGILRLPLPWVLLCLVPLSIVWTWRGLR
jgi:chromate transporter